MEAGRDLDKLVAEKIFGMKVYPEGNWVAGPVFKIEPDQVGFMNEISVPHYSTDIKDAWLIIETIDMLGRFNISHERGAWRITDDDPGAPDCPILVAEADTAPLAICLAALRSVGIKIQFGCEMKLVVGSEYLELQRNSRFIKLTE